MTNVNKNNYLNSSLKSFKKNICNVLNCESQTEILSKRFCISLKKCMKNIFEKLFLVGIEDLNLFKDISYCAPIGKIFPIFIFVLFCFFKRREKLI